MSLKIVEFIISPETYAARGPSDVPNRDLSIDVTVGSKTCNMCKSKNCTCKDCSCKDCKNQKLNKVESLNNIIDSIFEADVIKDVESSYWEITSPNNKAMIYYKNDSGKDFKPIIPGDVVYVLKRNIKDSKLHKEVFDKEVLPRLEKESDIVSSGPTFYHFRPKPGTELKRRIIKFAKSPTGSTVLGSVGAMLGLTGLSIPFNLFKDVYKRVSKAGEDD